MAHFHTTESYLKKVCRIAKELDIGIEESALTCDAFELAFSDQETRRAIFGMIDQLDASVARKGEPQELIITYAVEVGADGIHVGRYTDYIPPGQMVELTPANQAMIYLKITDDFPTQEFLGPMIVNRPELPSLARQSSSRSCRAERGAAAVSADEVICSDKGRPSVETHPGHGGLTDSDNNKLPSLAEEGCPVGRGGVAPSDTTQSEIPTELPSHWPKQAIPLGPIRLKFNERFPCALVTRSSSQRTGSPAGNPAFRSKALEPPHHLPLSAALPAGMLAFRSGLSPPLTFGDLGHSDAKDVHWQ